MVQFKNVWDALEDDPIKRENLKIRSHLMIEINAKIDEGRETQKKTSADTRNDSTKSVFTA